MSEVTPEGGGAVAVEAHSSSVERVFDALETDESGLSAAEAERRVEEYGPNQIQEEDEVSPLAVFISQFRNGLIYILVFAAVLSVLVGVLPDVEPRFVDAGLILAILLANGVFGFVQDYRAEQSLRELRELATPDAMVIRDGEKVVIDASELVPGDVVVLEQGDAVPADARLFEEEALETMEASLTGESETVAKSTDELDLKTPLAERANLVFKGTNVTSGHGLAVVVATGMETEIGTIATHIQEAEDEQTPFQRELGVLGKHIGYGIGVVIVFVAVVQFLLTGADTIAVFLTAVTLAVAAVPEGLPAIVTLTLSLGARRMVDRKALVRRLPVVESLGSVDVILTDKTGTLTENRMTVQRIYAPERTISVTGTGYRTEGEFREDGDAIDPEPVESLLRCGAICNNAERAPESAEESYYGDPTEIAMLVSAEKAGLDPERERERERLREIPFSSDRMRMSVVVPSNGSATGYMKGAPETILERCDRILEDGSVRELTPEKREAVVERTEDFASDALRVLAFSRRDVSDPDADAETVETGHVFLGLQGMLDPPRPEVDGAIERCHDAGIRVAMATGDTPETAAAIGDAVGIDSSGVSTGRDVDEWTDEELREIVGDVDIFARVEPSHKVRLLRTLQENGYTVAMTGDGVNDAPGLRSADVGIAMGVRGTDIAQEASDMVLQDDNFATIVEAIAEGRRIFDNIRKFVNLLLSANTAEVLAVFFGVLVGTFLFTDRFTVESEALILTPVMLLWINLVTDGLPAITLGVDPRASDILDRAPRSPDESVIDARVVASILSIGVTATVVGLVLFFETLATVGTFFAAQTVLFTFLVVVEMGIIQVIRRRFGQSIGSNPFLLAAVVGSLALHALVLYTPLAGLFGVIPLGWAGWARVLGGVFVVVVVTYLASFAFDRAFD